MGTKRYDFEGSVYVSVSVLKEIAERFLKNEGKDKDWTDLNDYIWDYYSDHDNWNQVLDDITDDVYSIYEKLLDKENEEE